MCKRLILWNVLLFWAFSATALGAVGDSSPVLTGTVNIVLANANGVVVLTDSNQTWRAPNGEPFTSSVPGQKLFRIDDRTVCSIAGFGSAPLSRFPEFTNSAAGVLDTYVEELRRKGGMHSFREKLTSLEFLFDMQLTGIGNLQHLSSAELGSYGFELILAGYDTDGTVKIGKIVLSASILPNGIFSPVLRDLSETTVARELAHETAGMGGEAVEYILSHPREITDEPEITKYARSEVSDRGSSLTLAGMESLAKSLARLSALFESRTYPMPPVGFREYWPVGGDNQIAILEKGSLRQLKQPKFEERRLNMMGFSIVTGLILDAHGLAGASLIGPGPGSLGLYIKNLYLGGLIHLDSEYYFDDEFRNATFYYDGGMLGFDPSNRVIDCILSLGPHVDRRSPAVQELIARFPWKTVN
jgi:hypothetical protein